ncbi:MAG TPA: hypothetical protein VGO69_08850 [Pyrinomonadaceae bacterium]|nr:hypothetical protein [Pyrinomonadaceae bacterium]
MFEQVRAEGFALIEEEPQLLIEDEETGRQVKLLKLFVRVIL